MGSGGRWLGEWSGFARASWIRCDVGDREGIPISFPDAQVTSAKRDPFSSTTHRHIHPDRRNAMFKNTHPRLREPAQRTTPFSTSTGWAGAGHDPCMTLAFRTPI